MGFAVVIPVFNKCELTERCLDSLLLSSRLRVICVVDNGSQDLTPVVLESFRKQFEAKSISFHVQRNAENVGFGRACNQGIRYVMGFSDVQHIAIVNNDTWMMPGWDSVLIHDLERTKSAVVGPYFFEGPFENVESIRSRAARFVKMNQGKIRRHFVPILMFFHRSAIEALRFEHGGIFDERFFVTYEDTDLLHRMRLLKFRFVQSASCFIWHHSQGTRGDSKLVASGHEVEGLRLFKEKWGFDPRPLEHTWIKKIRRSFWRFKEKRGRF